MKGFRGGKYFGEQKDWLFRLGGRGSACVGKRCRARVAKGGIMVGTEAGCLRFSGVVGFGGGRSGKAVQQRGIS